MNSIDTKLGLERHGDQRDFYRDSLSRFVGYSREVCVQITDPLNGADTATALVLVHGLRGAAGTLGAEKLANFAGAIESVLDAGLGLDARDERLQGLSAELARVNAEIYALYGQVQSDSGAHSCSPAATTLLLA